MIRYDLRCSKGDEFEAWFASIADYDAQEAKGLIECPHCGSKHVTKAPMAPAVIGTKKSKAREERKVAMAMAAEVKKHIADNFEHVGARFPDEARKMHEGEIEHRLIWGEATPEEAKQMAEEGLPVAPLPSELAPTPPRKVN
ncbi:MAG: DUF1178 family protein [Hyphomonadaceae bacterium]